MGGEARRGRTGSAPPGAAAPGEAPRTAESGMRRAAPRACRVLLVEDEDMVRKVVVRMLLSRGYQVTTATNAREAQLLFKAANGEFDLLISDVMIPEGNGPELARELTARCPSLRVLFVSGYTGWSDAGGLAPEQVRFLTKPFGSAELTHMIEELLPREAEALPR